MANDYSVKKQMPDGPGQQININNDKLIENLENQSKRLKSTTDLMDKVAIKYESLSKREQEIFDLISKQNDINKEFYEGFKEKLLEDKISKGEKSEEDSIREESSLLKSVSSMFKGIKELSFSDFLTNAFNNIISPIPDVNEMLIKEEGTNKGKFKPVKNPTIDDMMKLDAEYSLGYILLYNKLDELFGKGETKAKTGESIEPTSGIGGFLSGIGGGIKGLFTGIASGLDNLGKDFGTKMKGVLVLVALASAIGLSAIAFSLFSEEIDWISVLFGIGVLTAFATAVAFISEIINVDSALKFSASIALISGGLLLSAMAFNLFNSVDWLDALIGIGVLGALGVVAALLGPVAPLIISGAIAIAVLGASLMPFALSLLALSGAMTILGGIDNLKDIFIALGEGLMAFAPLFPMVPIFALLGVSLIPLALGLLTFSLSLSLLSKISNIQETLMQFAEGLFSFVGKFSPIDAIAFAAVGASLIPLGVGIMLIAPALMMLKGLQGSITNIFNELAQGLFLFSAKISSFLPIGAIAGISIALLGAGLILLAPALLMLNSLKGSISIILSELGKGLTDFSVGMLAISPIVAITGIALGILGAGLLLLSPSLLILNSLQGKMNLIFSDLAEGLSIFAESLSIAAPILLLGGIALAPLAVSLLILSASLTVLSGLTGKIIPALLELSNALVQSGPGFLLAAFVVTPGLLALSAAFIPFTAVLLVLGTVIDTLPKIAEGITLFSSIDGTNLILVAAGIAAISGSLALFGGGNLLSGIGSAIGEFFGGDPVEKFKKFADIAEPLKMAADAIESLVESINKLANPEMSTKISRAGDTLLDFKKKIGLVENKKESRFTPEEMKQMEELSGNSMLSVKDALIKSDGTIVEIDPKDNVYVTTKEIMADKGNLETGKTEDLDQYEKMMELFAQILQAIKGLKPTNETNIINQGFSTNMLLQKPNR